MRVLVASEKKPKWGVQTCPVFSEVEHAYREAVSDENLLLDTGAK